MRQTSGCPTNAKTGAGDGRECVAGAMVPPERGGAGADGLHGDLRPAHRRGRNRVGVESGPRVRQPREGGSCMTLEAVVVSPYACTTKAIVICVFVGV